LDPPLSIVDRQGFAAVPAEDLTRLGWAVSTSGKGILARWKGGAPIVEIRPDTPFLSWDGDGVHLGEAPYMAAGQMHLPLQFFIDVLPWKLPEVFRYDPDSRILQVRVPDTPNGFHPDPVKVVVIDPGHGGPDPGAVGPGGTREKDVALAIGRALARNLKDDSDLQVYLTRDADTLIPIWKRGEMATAWKGANPGVFISIHANALPNSRATRGFETYFLSEARNEHERRVAALENAAQEFETQEEGPSADPDLSFILTELRSLDHQHWSALLAELTQDRLAPFHPGPNRGVKQGPLAVITNALMPAVLVEVGFITSPEEERVLTEGTFQVNTANAIASAVREFFRRYSGEGSPPVEGSAPVEGSPPVEGSAPRSGLEGL
jgi:N-acetylmuramoyl-L-alanine amidase